MKYSGTQLLLLLLIPWSFSSCKKEIDPTPQLVLGHWEIQEAYRNGKPTESLADLFFEFKEEGKMATNLPVTEVPMEASYEVKKGKIEQAQGDITLVYQIESLTDSSMVLKTNFRGFDFRFVLGKSRLQ
ncbi:MAG: hypothetical protein IPH16_06700 [Haliscomenobacter sp.]|nr:hypothetical protein [Haliscomenobacter sp.]MBK7475668.1 hypothetical protein [Haliscomenobacter sp.]MBK8880296.1 hypothetical protein [Haliscomenobacter sp.]